MRHRSRIEALGSRQRSGAFTVCFPSWNDILFVCARTPAELVGAWQPSFQKIKCFSGLFLCVPVLLHAIVILIAFFFSFKKVFVLSLTLPIVLFLFVSLCHGRLAKLQFRPQSAKVQDQICVFYDTLLRVLAVGAVFSTHGTRNVSRQHLRQLSGIASESLVHSHETNNP